LSATKITTSLVIEQNSIKIIDADQMTLMFSKHSVRPTNQIMVKAVGKWQTPSGGIIRPIDETDAHWALIVVT